MRMTFPYRKVYGAPLVFAVITLYGLLSALIGDGVWDELSWIALASPLAIIVWRLCNSKRAG